MNGTFDRVAETIAVGVEAGAALLIAIGAIEALIGSLSSLAGKRAIVGERRAVWVRFGGWLLLALEFELAADILRSAISPTWESIGQLAAIAVIRTFLSFFLERDIRPAETEA